MFFKYGISLGNIDEDIKKKIKDRKAIHSSLGAEFFIDNYKYVRS